MVRDSVVVCQVFRIGVCMTLEHIGTQAPPARAAAVAVVSSCAGRFWRGCFVLGFRPRERAQGGGGGGACLVVRMSGLCAVEAASSSLI